MLLILIPIRNYIGKTGMVIAAFFLALSPSFLYYSRFYREDIFISFFTLMVLVCGIKYAENIREGRSILRLSYLFLGGVALASMAALKENAYIMMALVIFFMFLLFIREGWYRGFFWRIRNNKILIGEGIFLIIVVLVVFSLFYTGKFLDFYGMKAAFGRAVSHWYEMHRIQRIGGPWFFYLPIITLYEHPVLIFGALGIAHYSGCCGRKIEKILIIMLLYWVAVDIMYIISNMRPELSRFLPTTYIASSIVVFFPLVILGIIAVLKSQNLFFSFLAYWTLTNLAIYSYLQEKVPWLVLNPLLPLAIIAAAYLGELLSGIKLNSRTGAAIIIILAVSSSYFVYSSLLLNYYNYTDPAEPLIQAAQPPQKFSLFIDKINEISRQYQNQSTEIQVTDTDMETQFLWYLRHFTNVQWKVSIESELNAPLIVVHDSDDKHEPDIVKSRLRVDYERLDSAKMSWYWFAPSDITPKYLLFRKMDKPPGEYRVVLFYKPKD
ncbi:Uncharacterised protein [uncultured archaeon]|nr:Uncharacterised protein [uncultured archaeon]